MIVLHGREYHVVVAEQNNIYFTQSGRFLPKEDCLDTGYRIGNVIDGWILMSVSIDGCVQLGKDFQTRIGHVRRIDKPFDEAKD